MVDTGETHNFLNMKEARRIGMCLTKDTGQFKIVDSKPVATERLVKDVQLKLGPWGGLVNFTVAPINVFDMVMGIEFLTQANAIPIPAVSFLLIMGDCPCLLLTSSRPLHKKKLLSAIQFKKVFKQSDLTFVVMPVMSRHVELKPTILSIQKLLILYENIILEKLTQSLPPRRSMNYEIELLSRVKPPARTPY
ncbi:hypothetical protein CFOL_v3_23793 [Cephalotus follicularis]|uniref:RVP_2 domain-containing protein n=1 Tax=Cephalotus follicularis TaxID=3775 RepID=A0A1Q3CJQ1_CEPFO|nr:hypothetical protein CFOL_v3_23793 [Cephalotus follicularis]